MDHPTPHRTTTVHKVFYEVSQEGFSYFYRRMIGCGWWSVTTGQLFNLGSDATEGSRVGEEVRRTLLGL
jgi:hypothetical protein